MLIIVKDETGDNLYWHEDRRYWSRHIRHATRYPRRRRETPAGGRWVTLTRHLKELKEVYLENRGNRCLYCKAKTIEATRQDADDDWCSSKVECMSCGENWTDIYTLSDVTKDVKTT